MAAPLQTIEASKGGGRVLEFRVKGSGGFLNLAALQSCTVVVDAPDGTDLYTAACLPHATDDTIRLAVITGPATTTAGIKDACIHWTDAAGIADAERFRLVVYEHA